VWTEGDRRENNEENDVLRFQLAGGLCALLVSLHASPAAFDCLVEPTQAVEVSSPVVGLLERVHVRRGDRVSKGQVIATIESHAEQAAADLARFKSQAVGPTLSAEGKIEFSQRKFQRRAQMATEKLMSTQDRDDAEAEFKLAEAELQVAKENRQLAAIELQQQTSLLNLRTLRSPFDGVVVDQVIYPGEVVEPSGAKKTILKLAQLDPLRVHVILPMAAFRKITQGMSAQVTLEAPLGGTYSAKVKTLDKLIDAASGTFAAFLEMRNADLAVPAGVKCKAEFPIAIAIDRAIQQ
jgi:RND family efflux transporter MFP subunit